MTNQGTISGREGEYLIRIRLWNGGLVEEDGTEGCNLDTESLENHQEKTIRYYPRPAS